jgi:hypothetical protein
MCAHIGNYLYYVAALRVLGPAEYAQLSAVVALGNIVFVPFSGVQAAVAREIAAAPCEAAATVRWVARRVSVVQVAGFAVLAALWPVAQRVWSLESASIWLAGVTWIALGIGMQSWLGVAQGEQRFLLVGGVLAGPQGLMRVSFLLPLALVWGVVGGLWALVAATVVGIALLGPSVVRAFRAAAPPRWRAPGRPVPQLALAVVALLAFGSLVNVDVPIVTALLPDVDAGRYAAASLLAKIAFYAPAVLALMLLPNVTARLADGRPVARPILVTLGATAGTGLLVLLALVVAPAGLVTFAFGSDYDGVLPTATALTAVMTCAAVVNVHLMVALATRDRLFVSVLVCSAALQVVLLLVLGSSAAGAVVASAISFGSLLVVYEAVSPQGAVRLLLEARKEKR